MCVRKHVHGWEQPFVPERPKLPERHTGLVRFRRAALALTCLRLSVGRRPNIGICFTSSEALGAPGPRQVNMWRSLATSDLGELYMDVDSHLHAQGAGWLCSRVLGSFEQCEPVQSSTHDVIHGRFCIQF